jgi:hypothetical protein
MHQRVGRINRALSSVLARKELRDLVALPTGLNEYRPHPAVHLPVERRKLWKYHDSKDLDLGSSVLPGSKYMLECSP